MTEYEAMLVRNSVRRYLDKPLEQDVIDQLQAAVALANEESGLHIQLVTEEPEAFAGGLAHYGKFSGVRNYFAVCGPKNDRAEQLAGYYGERLVLFAQRLGLNTCWVALSFSKKKARFELAEGERLIIMIALGYGATQGVAHKSRPATSVARAKRPVPNLFAEGVAAAMLAPTAINQQKFHFTLLEEVDPTTGKPLVKPATRIGTQVLVDLGIAMYHFELGAGRESFCWAGMRTDPAIRIPNPGLTG